MTRKKKAKKAVRKTGAARRSVKPFYAKAVTEQPEGSMAGDYDHAKRSKDPRAKWRRFLEKHTPADGLYQDGFHYNRVRAAQFELMRLEYLNGNVKAGDRLLARLQDVS